MSGWRISDTPINKNSKEIFTYGELWVDRPHLNRNKVRSLHNYIILPGEVEKEIQEFISKFLRLRITTGSMPLYKVSIYLTEILGKHKIYDLKVFVYLDRIVGSYVVDFEPLHGDRPRWNRENKL